MINIIISYCEVAYAESFNLASGVFDSFTYICFKLWSSTPSSAACLAANPIRIHVFHRKHAVN